MKHVDCRRCRLDFELVTPQLQCLHYAPVSVWTLAVWVRHGTTLQLCPIGLNIFILVGVGKSPVPSLSRLFRGALIESVLKRVQHFYPDCGCVNTICPDTRAFGAYCML